MPGTLLVCAAPVVGQDEYYCGLVSGFGTVIAVDDGASLCLKAGRVPDLVIGDLDSLPERVVKILESSGVEIERHPSHKDLSDLDLALDHVRARGLRGVTVTAGWSARLDHTLAAVGSVVRAADLHVDLADPGLSGWVLDAQVRPSLALSGPGGTFSLLAPGGPAVVSCVGARYSLDRDVLDPLSSWGLSNQLGLQVAQITVHQGRLVAISPQMPGTCGLCECAHEGAETP